MKKIILFSILILATLTIFIIPFIFAADVSPDSIVYSGTDYTSEMSDIGANTVTFDMKDASKRVYMNFSSNLDNGDDIRIYCQANKGLTVGIYDYFDTDGTTPVGTFTCNSGSYGWSNVTLASLSSATDAFWMGEGTGSGDNPKEDFDYIYAVTSGADPCAYGGSGNWVVDCADDCYIDSNVVVDGSDIIITGTGTFTTEANITGWGDILIEGTDGSNRCEVYCIGGGCFKE